MAVAAAALIDGGVPRQMVQPFHGEHRVVLRGHGDDDEDVAGDVEDVRCTDAAAVAVAFPEAAAYEAGDDVGWASVAGHGDCATARDGPGDAAVVDDGGRDGVVDEEGGPMREGDVLGNIVAAAVVVGDGVG